MLAWIPLTVSSELRPDWIQVYTLIVKVIVHAKNDCDDLGHGWRRAAWSNRAARTYITHEQSSGCQCQLFVAAKAQEGLLRLGATHYTYKVSYLYSVIAYCIVIGRRSHVACVADEYSMAIRSDVQFEQAALRLTNQLNSSYQDAVQ
jgi:hypothetical protein